MSGNMVFKDSKRSTLRKERVVMRIDKNTKKINEYKDDKESLSVHGHWSLGYFEGENTILEELLDDYNDKKLVEVKEVVVDSNSNTLGLSSLKHITATRWFNMSYNKQYTVLKQAIESCQYGKDEFGKFIDDLGFVPFMGMYCECDFLITKEETEKINNYMKVFWDECFGAKDLVNRSGMREKLDSMDFGTVVEANVLFTLNVAKSSLNLCVGKSYKGLLFIKKGSKCDKVYYTINKAGDIIRIWDTEVQSITLVDFKVVEEGVKFSE